jgi:hypothetical protein
VHVNTVLYCLTRTGGRADRGVYTERRYCKPPTLLFTATPVVIITTIAAINRLMTPADECLTG